ncbi:Ribosomal RNA small subunit methyltransferase G [Candidatus Tremblaya princeps]|uniref:Ribosomal RNA small subunit methyltransferase G n=1 Tax=Tremblaya princeps TaxID=189385 RepID=A0A143WN18_TREPR|nr:Ribosomal RNA small subunit methyltransferase G [Candidatus Tremblaya princeps]
MKPADVAEHMRRCACAIGMLLSAHATRAMASLSRSIARWNATHGLTSRGPMRSTVVPHICDAASIGAVVVSLIRPAWPGMPVTVVDMGSGAGLPGMALGAMMPCLRVISLEATPDKSVFQSYMQRKLGLCNLRVLRPTDASANVMGAEAIIARALVPYPCLLRSVCRQGWSGAVITASGSYSYATTAVAARVFGCRSACAARLKVPMVSKRRFVVITGAACLAVPQPAMQAGAL